MPKRQRSRAAPAPPAPERPSEPSAPGLLDRWDLAAGGGVALLALAARLTYVWQIASAGLGPYLRLDPLYYHQWGQRIAAGDWIGRDVFEMSPLYAYYLGILYRLFGEGEILPRILQCLLGAIVCGLLVLVGRRAFSKLTGLGAGLLFALYAPALFYDGQVMKTSFEISFATLTTFSFFAASPRGGPPSPRWLFAGGALLGLTALMRENILVAAPIFLVWAIWPREGATAAARLVAAGALIGGTLLPILPFTIRNLVVARQAVLITSLGGENFYTGNNEIASGRYTPPPFIRPDPEFEHEDFRREAERRVGRPLTRKEASDFWYAEGIRFIASHPLKWLALLADKLAVFWNDFERPDNFNFYNFKRFSSLLAAPLPHFAWVAPLGLLGIALSWPRWRLLLPFLIVLLAFVASAMIFFTQARYRMPVTPTLCLFAVDGGVALLTAARERRLALLAWALPLLAVLFVIVLLPPGNTDLFEAQNHSLLAEMYLETGRLDVAASEYRACIASIRSLPVAGTRRGKGVEAGAHAGLAQVLLKQGDDPGAIEELKLASDAPRENVRFAADTRLGELLQLRGDARGSAEAFRRAVLERPEDFEARMSYAEALDRIGMTREAMAQLDKAISLNPEDRDAPRIREALARRLEGGR